jgi:hypothetical protein
MYLFVDDVGYGKIEPGHAVAIITVRTLSLPATLPVLPPLSLPSCPPPALPVHVHVRAHVHGLCRCQLRMFHPPLLTPNSPLSPLPLPDTEDLYRAALLIDQLKNEDLLVRTNAFRQLPTIGS